jgi:hypothetical protein
MSDDRVQAYLPPIQFTEADLVANRRGELTVDQQLRLGEVAGLRTRVASSNASWGVVMVVVLFGAGVAIEWDSGAPIGAWLTFGALLVAFLVTVTLVRRSSSGLANRQLSFAEGVATPVVEQRPWGAKGRRYTVHELQLQGGSGRRAFPFADQASLDEVPAGQWLRVYFLENPPYPMILSYEVVPR